MNGRPVIPLPSQPFTLEHFEWWCGFLILDNGEFVKLEPFQRRFVEDLFAGRHVNWLLVPEGNGKTTLLAALGLYGLRFALARSPEGAVIPIAASSRDQIRVMYRQMKGFVRRSKLENPDEEGYWFECFDGYRQVHLRAAGKTKRGETMGLIEIHAADAGTADGVIPFPYAFLDELHRHRDLSLHMTWTGKLDKRHAQLVVISTAGEPGTDFEVIREKIRLEAVEVEEKDAFGRYAGPRVVMHEYALRSEFDADDFEAVKAANPLESITVQSLREKRGDPTMTDRHWRRFTCNLATLDEGTDLFIDGSLWDSLVDELFTIESGAEVCLGGDGSRTWDTTVVAWARRRPNGHVDVDARVFSVRGDVAHHTLHRGGRIDFDDVEQFLLDRFDEFNVLEAAYDPRYMDRSMDIVEARLPDARIAAVEPNSKQMRDALQAMFNLAAEGKLRHRGDRVLAAHLANAGVDRGFSGEIRRVRKVDGRLPIDAVPAMALAVWRASVALPKKRAVLTTANPW